MGAVVDRATTFTREYVKGILGITDASSDDLLDLLVPASKEVADEYLNNPFEDPDGVELDIPNAVLLGLVEWIRDAQAQKPAGATQVRVGDWSVRYSDRSDTGHTQIPASAEKHWQYFRLIPRDEPETGALQSIGYVGA